MAEPKRQVMLDKETHRLLKTVCTSSGLTMEAGIRKMLELVKVAAEKEKPGSDFFAGGMVDFASKYLRPEKDRPSVFKKSKNPTKKINCKDFLRPEKSR